MIYYSDTQVGVIYETSKLMMIIYLERLFQSGQSSMRAIDDARIEIERTVLLERLINRASQCLMSELDCSIRKVMSLENLYYHDP